MTYFPRFAAWRESGSPAPFPQNGSAMLEQNCVEVAGGAAKANLLAVPGGHAAPIVFGGSAASVDVTIRALPRVSGNLRCELLHPGEKGPDPVPASLSNGALKMRVRLKRGYQGAVEHSRLSTK